MTVAAATACAVCGGWQSRPLWGSLLVECSGCRLVRADDRFFSVDPQRLYDVAYFCGSEYVDYRGDRRAAVANARRRAGVLRRLAPHARTLLEIGAAYGYFVEEAARYWRAAGVEVSAHAAMEARQRGVDCVQGDYVSADAPALPPDIVCMWDTIEHLVDPRRVMDKIAAEIAPGGVVAISTGDIGSWLPRLQRGGWRQIHPPTHLWYFSAETLGRLLNETGFRVVRAAHPPLYRSLRLCLPQLASRLPRWAGDIAVPFQTWDLVEMYAVRA